MSLLDKFDHFNNRLSFVIEWIALTGILIMIAVTCIDVIGSKIFRIPLPGSIDIVMLTQVLAIAFATASTLISGRHVQVEFFIPLLPEHIADIINAIINFLGSLLFIIIIWRLFMFGYSLQTGNEISPTINIPLYPFAYGISLASIPVCISLLSDSIRSAIKVIKK